ncbi:MAG: hypothetical protein ACRYFR_13610 [Janthinobacterium lividum]
MVTGPACFFDYPGPQMPPSKTDILFGTIKRPTETLVDTVLRARSALYVYGVSF